MLAAALAILTLSPAFSEEAPTLPNIDWYVGSGGLGRTSMDEALGGYMPNRCTFLDNLHVGGCRGYLLILKRKCIDPQATDERQPWFSSKPVEVVVVCVNAYQSAHEFNHAAIGISLVLSLAAGAVVAALKSFVKVDRAWN